jgi:hypothetical protein
MKSLDEYLRDAEQAHGHLCAGQVLGVRLAMLGLIKLGIDDPQRQRKTASGSSPSSRSTAAPPTPLPWSLAAAWASAP